MLLLVDSELIYRLVVSTKIAALCSGSQSRSSRRQG